MIQPIMLNFRFASVDTHAHTDGGLCPMFSLQINLRFHRSSYRLPSRMKCGAETIANDLEDIAMLRFNCLPQDGMMTFPYRLPGITILLRQAGTAFDIGKQEGHCARRQ